MNEQMNVVVIGGIHHNTLGVVRSLGEERDPNLIIFVIVVGDTHRKKNIVSTSKYVASTRYFVVREDSEIIKVLLGLKKLLSKAVIICCSDGSAEIVIKNKRELDDTFCCPSSIYDITKLMEKQIQTKIARDSGFNVPYSNSISLENASSWVDYPCITKPEKSCMGKGKADICICSNHNELIQYLKSIESREAQVQKFIVKKMEYQLIGCSIMAGNELIIPGYTNIIRQPFNTNTGYLQYSPIDDLNYDATAVKQFMRKIGYSGLFSLEFIRDKNDTDFFLEINLRNDGNAYCVKSAGVNLPYFWVKFNYHHEMPNNNLNVKEKVYFMPEFPDARIGIKEIGLFKWIGEFLGAKAHAIFNIRDLRPFFCKVISLFSK